MDRTLVIVGKGKATLTPDLVIMNFPIVVNNKDYKLAVDELNQIVHKLKDLIADLGVERSKLQTKKFSVNPNHELDDKTGKYKFKDYVAQHNLILEIPFDHNLTNEIISSVMKSGHKIDFRIVYGVQDKEGNIQALLEDAIKDAKFKAEIIAKASNVSLMEILNIDHSFDNYYFQSDTGVDYGVNAYTLMELADITPMDIDISERVKITWRIE